jgi:hypothetical protein
MHAWWVVLFWKLALCFGASTISYGGPVRPPHRPQGFRVAGGRQQRKARGRSVVVTILPPAPFCRSYCFPHM